MSTEPRVGRPLPRQRGVSLIELIMFIIIVGIAVAAIAQVFSVATRANADPMLRRQALAVAQALMEEISYKPFANPPGGFSGPYTPANRHLFDDVMDYNGFSMNGIVRLDGTLLVGLSDYQAAIAVVSAGFGPVPISAGWRVTVTVTDPIGEDVILEGYRANY